MGQNFEASNLNRLIVADDPIAALMIARNLAREGLDTSELSEAAIAALNPREVLTVSPPCVGYTRRIA